MDKAEDLILADKLDSHYLQYGETVYRKAAAELRRLPAENERLTIEREWARRLVREAHEMGTRVVAQRDALLEALRWIATVNATDREYQAKARAAIKAVEEEA